MSLYYTQDNEGDFFIDQDKYVDLFDQDLD